MIRLYLVQHGEAHPENVDPARSLTDTGRLQIMRSAEGIKRLQIVPDMIFTSTKKRAVQSAEIFSEVVGIRSSSIVQDDVFKPSGDPESALRFIKEKLSQCVNESTLHLLIAGHMPSVAKIANVLTGCGESIAFKNGAVLCIETELLEQRAGKILWYILPEQFEILAAAR